MGPFTFWINGPIPAQNEIIAAAKGHGGRGIGYSRMKFQWTTDIALAIRTAKIPPMQRVRLRFDWVSVDRKHDPDNIEAGQKFVWDALKHEIAGVLTNDGWGQNAGSEHHHELGPKPGVRVTVTEVEGPAKAKRATGAPR